MASSKNPDRVLLGRIGAYTAHSRHSGLEMTHAAREAFRSKFERDVDPEGVLDPTERTRRADMARRAHFARLAYLSAVARRRRRARMHDDLPGGVGPGQP